MSLSLVTALVLQKNEIRCFSMGPFPNGKYGSVAYFIKDGMAEYPVMSIQNGEFDTCKEAIDKLDEVVKAVRELDLPLQKERLKDFL